MKAETGRVILFLGVMAAIAIALTLRWIGYLHPHWSAQPYKDDANCWQVTRDNGALEGVFCATPGPTPFYVEPRP